MSDISVHHSKEEREGHNEVNARISFFVGRDRVFVYDLLENSCEFIQFEVSWRVECRCWHSLNLQIVLSR